MSWDFFLFIKCYKIERNGLRLLTPVNHVCFLTNNDDDDDDDDYKMYENESLNIINCKIKFHYSLF